MISYKPLLKLLIDREIKKKDLQKEANLSWSTIAKFNTNENVSLEIIDRLCFVLKSQPGDLIEYIADQEVELES